MHFLIMCMDCDEGLELRARHRPEHMEHVAAIMDNLMVAGPTFAADGETTLGSFFIVEAETRAAAQALIERDPFHAAGVWRSVEIHPAKSVAGRWVGGMG